MIFVIGAGGVMLASIVDKIAEDSGNPAIGMIVRGGMAVVAAGTIAWFLASCATGFLL
ncbi:hypothetical protein [Bacillus massiliglaciei]|uniref:hypothetical protein n=1 Tax=Bacillus massiliglaciei TaxID=1816693 RepID=UPI0018FEEE11|nr:hypothetical protein [Bacillus massiliglaciei]